LRKGFASNTGTLLKLEFTGTWTCAHDATSIRVTKLISKVSKRLIIELELVNDEALALTLLEVFPANEVVEERNAKRRDGFCKLLTQ